MHWLRGDAKDTVAEDLAAFGAEPEEVARAAPATPAHYEVWPENWEAVLAFIACGTQWRRLAVAPYRLAGLDYAALEAVLRLRRVKDRRDVFERVRVLEQAVLQQQNAKR